MLMRVPKQALQRLSPLRLVPDHTPNRLRRCLDVSGLVDAPLTVQNLQMPNPIGDVSGLPATEL